MMASVTRKQFEAMVKEVERTRDSFEIQKTPLIYLYPDLDLSGLDLSGMELTCFNFDFLNLTDANLSNCDLYGTSFYGATLLRTKLRNVTVGRPPGNHSHHWCGGDFTEADFTGTKLTSISFDPAWSNSGSWRSSSSGLSEWMGPLSDNGELRRRYKVEYPTKFDRAIMVDTDMRWMHLEGISFFGADMTRAKLSYSFFNEANMERAILIGANIEDTDLTGANLSYSNMNGASIDNFSKFSKVNLTGAIMININAKQSDNSPDMFASVMGPIYLYDANCTDADMRGLHFSRGFGKINFTNARLNGIRFGSGGPRINDCNFTGANLTDADFSRLASIKDCDFTDANICGADVSNFVEKGEGIILTGAKFNSATKQAKAWFWPRKNKMVRMDD